MQNRMGWILGMLAVGATLAAVGYALNGYPNTPPKPRPGSAPAAASAAAETDPLAPRFLDQGRSIRVHMAGAVKKPGVYSLPAWARVTDGVKAAKGFAANADPDAINLADPLRDGEQVRIPLRGRPERLEAHRPTPEPPPVPPAAGGRGLGRYPFAVATAGSRQETGSGTVNLNTASREQLDALPGIGPATAEQIVAYREQHGPFLQPEDLMNVKGIGPKKFERLRPRITAP